MVPSRSEVLRSTYVTNSVAMSCKLKPMIRAAKMVEKHLDGIINAIVLKATNALGESMNAKIQKIKSQACSYRNRQRFRDAIMFRLGGLDLYLRTASNPHGFLKRLILAGASAPRHLATQL